MNPSIQNLKHSWISIPLLLVIIGFTLSSCGSDSDDSNLIEYSGTFVATGNNVETNGTGMAEATYNSETGVVTYEAEWSGLTTQATNMHFHLNGPVIHGIDGWPAATSGSVSGSVTFSLAEAAALAAGDVYIMIHTQTYPGGEVNAFLE